jgi:SRSO17 transposase
VLTDAGYGNNTNFLQELEKKRLKYIGGVAKNRKVIIKKGEDKTEETRLDNLAKSLPQGAFSEIQLQLEKPRTVWVATKEIELSKYAGKKVIAIVMNAATFDQASDIDYLMTNVEASKATGEWIVTTYSQRNWIEVFYREAKGWLGLKEYQVRDKRSLIRHWILVFCAYTFILWHSLTGGLRRRWANKPLNTFADALEAFRTAISFRFVEWLQNNRDVFAAYKASLGLIWA